MIWWPQPSTTVPRNCCSQWLEKTQHVPVKVSVKGNVFFGEVKLHDSVWYLKYHRIKKVSQNMSQNMYLNYHYHYCCYYYIHGNIYIYIHEFYHRTPVFFVASGLGSHSVTSAHQVVFRHVSFPSQFAFRWLKPMKKTIPKIHHVYRLNRYKHVFQPWKMRFGGLF